MDVAPLVACDRDVDALYLRLRPGTVERAVEIGASIFMDVDQAGQPLGIAFLGSEGLEP